MPHSGSAASSQSEPSKEPRPADSATTMGGKDVITTLLEFFDRKQFPVDEGRLEALFESDKALVQAACQIVLDNNCYRDEVVRVHQAIK